MNLAHFALTDVGREREHNEDSLHVDAARGLYVVADGMGGHAAGETASRIAVESVAAAVARMVPEAGGPQGHELLAERIAGSIGEANEKVHAASVADRALAGMGTTLVALLVDGPRAVVGHVGDSRAYLRRGEVLVPVTEDHSLVQEELRAGLLTVAQARTCAYRNVITRCIGMDPAVGIDVATLELEPGDRLLLCSDGLNGMLDDDVIGRLLGEGTPEKAARSLVDSANDAGGEDNVTVIVVDVG
jgi:serine/threonine protein phosphatase PrpC